MKLRDVTKAAGTARLHVWPPQVLAQSAQSGITLIRPGEGVLKSLRRIGNRLSLTIEHEGREATSGVELDLEQKPSLDTVEKVLRANLGKPLKVIGDIDV
jgi:hypothetical protein